jgi:hypothetical protein
MCGTKNSTDKPGTDCSDNHSLQKKCSLHLDEYLSSMNDFSFCQNIYEVEVSSMKQLYNLQGFNNISCLKIIGCHNLITTEGIGKILKTLTIAYCGKLTRLVGLQGIPEVFIQDCDNVIDFSGVGNHEMFAMSHAVFDRLLDEYNQDINQHAEIFGTVRNFGLIGES